MGEGGGLVYVGMPGRQRKPPWSLRQSGTLLSDELLSACGILATHRFHFHAVYSRQRRLGPGHQWAL